MGYGSGLLCGWPRARWPRTVLGAAVEGAAIAGKPTGRRGGTFCPDPAEQRQHPAPCQRDRNMVKVIGGRLSMTVSRVGRSPCLHTAVWAVPAE